jgi:NAD+ synthase (glutamine-hydrolysing)
VQDGSRAFAAGYVYTNLVGNEAGRAIYDGGVLIAAAGRMLAAGRRFSFADRVLTVADCDVDALRLAQSRLAVEPVADAVEGDRIEVPFTPARVTVPVVSPTGDMRDAWEHGGHVKEEEFTRAVALGLFDYARKSKSRGFVVSASGGADSSAVACLVALAVRLAAGELSVVEAARRLGLPAPDAVADDTIRRLVTATLTCVYQSTANSGDVTRSAARGLAEALGAAFHEFDIEAIVRDYKAIVSRAIGRPLSWDHDDVALQNIQARVRSPGVWMIANITGALLVSTSNRSEAAVGYATMDGDTSGGIAPLAGIDKAYLRRWLRWLEHGGPEGVGPIPALAAVNVQAPTAELRPAASGQTDESDLMPYDVLDAILEMYVVDQKSPAEIRAAGFAEADVTRVVKLIDGSEHKRRQAAPGLKVTTKAFGVGRRIPVAQRWREV